MACSIWGSIDEWILKKVKAAGKWKNDELLFHFISFRYSGIVWCWGSFCGWSCCRCEISGYYIYILESTILEILCFLLFWIDATSNGIISCEMWCQWLNSFFETNGPTISKLKSNKLHFSMKMLGNQQETNEMNFIIQSSSFWFFPTNARTRATNRTHTRSIYFIPFEIFNLT